MQSVRARFSTRVLPGLMVLAPNGVGAHSTRLVSSSAFRRESRLMLGCTKNIWARRKNRLIETSSAVSADLVTMPEATQPADVLWLPLFYPDLHTALMVANGATAVHFNQAVYKRRYTAS